MTYSDNEKIIELRRKYDFYGSWDVALAVPHLESEGVTRMHRSLYENIAEGIESLGKSCFLPHRDLDIQLRKGDPFKILMEIVVPTSDLIIYHASMGRYGGTAQGMVTSANLGALLGKKAEPIWFIEEELYENLHEPGELRVITFSDHKDVVRKIKEEVKNHYR